MNENDVFSTADGSSPLENDAFERKVVADADQQSPLQIGVLPVQTEPLDEALVQVQLVDADTLLQIAEESEQSIVRVLTGNAPPIEIALRQPIVAPAIEASTAPVVAEPKKYVASGIPGSTQPRTPRNHKRPTPPARAIMGRGRGRRGGRN